MTQNLKVGDIVNFEPIRIYGECGFVAALDADRISVYLRCENSQYKFKYFGIQQVKPVGKTCSSVGEFEKTDFRRGDNVLICSKKSIYRGCSGIVCFVSPATVGVDLKDHTSLLKQISNSTKITKIFLKRSVEKRLK